MQLCVCEMNAWVVPAKPAIIGLMLPEELPSSALSLDGLIDLELRGRVGPAPVHPVPNQASYLPNAITAGESAFSGRRREG